MAVFRCASKDGPGPQGIHSLPAVSPSFRSPQCCLRGWCCLTEGCGTVEQYLTDPGQQFVPLFPTGVVFKVSFRICLWVS